MKAIEENIQAALMTDSKQQYVERCMRDKGRLGITFQFPATSPTTVGIKFTWWQREEDFDDWEEEADLSVAQLALVNTILGLNDKQEWDFPKAA